MVLKAGTRVKIEFLREDEILNKIEFEFYEKTLRRQLLSLFLVYLY